MTLITYLNGEYVAHEDAKISVDDRAVMLGDSIYEVTRTYGGRPFRLEEHLQRLCRSLRFVEMDGDRIVDEVRGATAEIIRQNQLFLEAVGDAWLDYIVTRGCPASGFDANAAGSAAATAMLDPELEPTVIVKLRKLRYALYGPLYERGVELNASLLTGHFAGAMDPRVKGANRLAATRAELKGWRARREGGTHYTVIFNQDGAPVETTESNLCIVEGESIVRPPRHEVVDGVSLNMLCDLARSMSFGVVERPLRLYDIINSDETMITATSFGVLPVNSIDGIVLRRPRHAYDRLLNAWIADVGFDFVAQAREMSEAQREPGIAATR